MNGDWRPTASPAHLRRRAALLDTARGFFRQRDVLEVETPAVLGRTVTDVQIESLGVQDGRYLQTSPEYPMKRLLAAGSGDLFQICRVFRAGERSRLHNPEFTMIEWYRLDFDLPRIMAETLALATALFAAGGRAAVPTETLTYQQAFQRTLGCDPLSDSLQTLRELAVEHGLTGRGATEATRDDLLDFLVATRIGPTLGQDRLTCLHHFPASQAALARLDAQDTRTAMRFELYADGVELANGYVELAGAIEQRARFEADRTERRRRGLAVPEIDERLLAAMDSGMPACAGVAMGFDRVVMLALGAERIDAVMAFPWERA